MEKKTAVIYANGTYPSRMFAKSLVEEADLILAVDGGGDTTAILSIRPDILIGDMDSISPENLERMKSLGCEIIRYPVQKDETDLELAVKEAVKRGAERILLTGMGGGRIDHTYANLMLLERIRKQGVEVEIREPFEKLFLIGPGGHVTLQENPGTQVSILPMTDQVTGVSLSGFAYPLKDALLNRDQAYQTISNVITLNPAEISLKEGVVLVDVITRQA